MIKIFDANDRDFSSAGNIIIEPIKCNEFKKKSLNGWYIEVEVPIKYIDFIKKDKLCVVKTKSKLNPQAFRIGENIEYSTRKIKFKAEHVMFDARDYALLDVRPTNMNGLNALSYINERTDDVSPFTMYSNVENIDTAYLIRKNLLQAWTIIEERWGGVFDADNWNISFLTSVGNDNGETIAYGKNVQGFDIFEDWSSVCTKLCPVGYDGLMLPEHLLISDVQYEKPYTRIIDFQTDLEGEEQTQENLLKELIAKAEAYLEENKVPKISYTIISNINEKLEIGDTIKVLHPFVTIFTEVLEYEYNLISKKVVSLTFGNYSRNVKTKFDNIKNTINQINQALSKQEVAINNQSNLINTLNKNGYVYIDDNEILILDTLPREDAKNVWRFGLGGIGFSSNGYEGPFKIAMTMDGQINANFITTGVMSVSRIEGLANQIGEYNRQIAEINISLGEIQQQVDNVVDLTQTVIANKSVVLANCAKGNLIGLRIKGNNNVFKYLYPSDALYPADNLYPMGDSRIAVTDKDNNTIIYELGVLDVLRQNGDIYDEYVLENGQAKVIRRINKDGTVKETEEIEDLGQLSIELKEGTNTLTIMNYTGEITVTYVVKNGFTNVFATKVEMNALITAKSNEIDLRLEEKLDEKKFTGANITLAINNDTSGAEINADKISLKRKTDRFNW